MRVHVNNGRIFRDVQDTGRELAVLAIKYCQVVASTQAQGAPDIARLFAVQRQFLVRRKVVTNKKSCSSHEH